MPEVKSPSQWTIAWKRHFLVTLALILNAAAIGVMVAVHLHNIVLPTRPNEAQLSIIRIMPALGAVAGTIVTAVTIWAISGLVTAYAKTVIVAEGMSFARIDHLHTVANAKIPFALSPLVLLAAVIAMAEGFLPSAIVSSLTPTVSPWTIERSLPIIDFSTASGVDPNITCEYYDTLGGTIQPGHGYGVNCPIEDKFGDLYNVALSSFWGVLPEISSRDGVSYPSDLLGISGAISSLAKDYAKEVTTDDRRVVLASDHLDVCLPRMIVDAKCTKSLPEGQYFDMKWHPVDGGTPQAMISVALCHNATNTCSDPPRYAPFYGPGVSIAFWDMDATSGNTTMSLYNFATYNDTDWGTEALQCSLGARETMVPIRIRGGASVEHLPDLACPQSLGRPQPSPHFLLNVTRMADMTLIKLQGQDGRIEPVVSVPPGRDRVDALGYALQNLVAVGATEMYANMYKNRTVTNQWADHVPLYYVTTRARLGNDSRRNLLFVLCPVALMVILIVGWCLVASRDQANIGFNPLHPASAMAAGMNRQELSTLVRAYDTADENGLGNLPVVLRFRPVTNERWGIDTRATHPDNHLRSDGQSYISLDYPPSASTDGPQSPGWWSDTKSLGKYSP